MFEKWKASPEDALKKELGKLHIPEIKKFCDDHDLVCRITYECPYLGQDNDLDSCPGIKGTDPSEKKYSQNMAEEKAYVEGVMNEPAVAHNNPQIKIEKDDRVLHARAVSQGLILKRGSLLYDGPTARPLAKIVWDRPRRNEEIPPAPAGIDDLYAAIHTVWQNRERIPLLKRYILPATKTTLEAGFRQIAQRILTLHAPTNPNVEEQALIINELTQTLFYRSPTELGLDIRGNHPMVVIARLLKRLAILPLAQYANDLHHRKIEKIHYPCYAWRRKILAEETATRTVLTKGNIFLQDQERDLVIQGVREQEKRLRTRLEADIQRTIRAVGYIPPQKPQTATYR